MPLGAFYLWTFFGSLIFCGGLILLGNSLGAHAHEVVDSVRKYALLILAAGIVALAAFAFIQTRRAKSETA
jgi:membrane protein DedA with SNARE-associated domain